MTIQGYVYDIESGEPLIGARVSLLDDEGNKSNFSTQTDKSGFFILDDPYIQSSDTILFEMIGYGKVKKDGAELEDAEVYMKPQVEFLSQDQSDDDSQIPISPTEEIPNEVKKDHTLRNLTILGGVFAVGALIYYFSKKKE